MQIDTPAIVCAVRPHGEHGVVARLLTPADGLVAGYVRGGRSRRLRPVLIAGNRVAASFRARSDEQLAALTVELAHSRAGLHDEPLAAAAIEWAATLAAATLPEGTPYPRLHAALDGLLDAIEAAPAARAWAGALVRFELLLLAELGFGLDLSGCAGGGDADDLAWVSPRTGRAVSRAVGLPHAARLLPLPRFLLVGGPADGEALRDGLRLTGLFLERDLLGDRRGAILAARERLVERFRRMDA